MVFQFDTSLRAESLGGLGTALDNAKKIAEIAAIFLGAVWAYYKFVRGRTFKQRLETVVTGTIHPDRGAIRLIASAQIKNVGLSKAPITQKGSALSVFAAVLTDRSMPSEVDWKQLLVLPIFINHHWMEPGETIKDQLLVNIPNSETFALKLELRIVGTNTIARNIESSAVSVIFLDEQLQSTTSFDPTSERSTIMSRFQEQKFESPDRTKQIEDAKLERQKKEDKKETQRIEHDKEKLKKNS
jgi:hypothetical protein